MLDGVGAGVFGIMQTLLVADLTKATGKISCLIRFDFLKSNPIDVVISDALCPDIGQAPPQDHEGSILKRRSCDGWHES
jgi:hypothetical protein